MNFIPASMGFLRVAAAVPEMRVADPVFNCQMMREAMTRAAGQGCRVVLFPELSVTGYSCGDLFYQELLLESAQRELVNLAAFTADLPIAAVVGLPVAAGGKIFNCAAFLCAGKILGLVPKTFLPTTHEYYEERWFSVADKAGVDEVAIAGERVPLGADLLFEVENFKGLMFGIEICEDLWAVNPPSGEMALAGATVLLNLSASNELLGKAEYRRDLVRQQSARCMAAYCYTSAGPGESTTDVVFSGHALIAENGQMLAEDEHLGFDSKLTLTDVDVQRMLLERSQNSSFSAALAGRSFRKVHFSLPEASAPSGELLRKVARTPFVPADASQRARHCKEIFALQSMGLAKRLKHTRLERVTLGLSGGLDSTLALLVTIKAYEILGLDRKGIIVITMPGFGTSGRTRGNAERLAELFGVTLRCIPINTAVRQHFKDIGQDENKHDVTFENSQARERTQILMDVANQMGGLVVGTGDLSELALGWSTYNGDHMSMYGVNAGVPKTLIRYLVEWCAESEFSGEISKVLADVCATPITAELLPLGEGEKLQQETELTIGPYLLHDFFLFYTVRALFSPRKVFFLAQQAFTDEYPSGEILRWQRLFYQRFFSQQFKRSALPDGPKIGSVALSPRGDWRMPSDASCALWMEEVRKMEEEAG